MKLVLATGGFDPIHEGHIEYLRAAKSLGDLLFVGLNSTEWLIRKKGYNFYSDKTRLAIISAFGFVDRAFFFDDKDDSAVDAIKYVQLTYPNWDIIFVNGGDRTVQNIPEMSVPGVEFIFGVGGNDKLNSSSWIVRDAKMGKIQSR